MGIDCSNDYRASNWHLGYRKAKPNEHFAELIELHERHPLRIMKLFPKRLQRVLSNLRSETGTIESALVMIPLISLFLVTLQLIATVNFRNVDMTAVQNRASFQAVQQDVYPEDKVIYLNSGDLFSKLRLIVVKAERDLPQIFPGVSQLFGSTKMKSTGVAVYEESEECNGGYLVC